MASSTNFDFDATSMTPSIFNSSMFYSFTEIEDTNQGLLVMDFKHDLPLDNNGCLFQIDLPINIDDSTAISFFSNSDVFGDDIMDVYQTD
jgi:hypothetical protein